MMAASLRVVFTLLVWASCFRFALNQVCEPGFVGNGRICIDVNECEVESLHGCPLLFSDCRNNNGSYKCLCKPGIMGDPSFTCTMQDDCTGTTCEKDGRICDYLGGYLYRDGVCTDIDECKIATDTLLDPCGENSECVNGNGSYWCNCISGYFKNGTHCEEIVIPPLSSCLINYGGCDFHMPCDDSKGWVECGDCPLGMLLNGSQCVTSCGNHVCDEGEDCVTCRKDCHSPCGKCGDRVCQQGENCTSCFEDCAHLCESKQCGGDPPCSGNGKCDHGSGLCSCFSKWSGPRCDKENKPVGFSMGEKTTPEMIFAPNISGEPTFFWHLTLTELREVDLQNNAVFSIKTGENWTLKEVQHTNSLNKEWNCNGTLENKAFVAVMIWYFGEEFTNVTMMNKTVEYPAQSLKLNVIIENWPFRSTNHSLVMVFDSHVAVEVKKSENVEMMNDESDSLKWFMITINGATMYGRFETEAYLDGTERLISFTLNLTESTISARVPHFWESMILDPTFSVLTDQGTEKDNSSNRLWIVAVAVVGGAIVVVILAVFAFPKLKLKYQLWQGRKVQLGETYGDVEMTTMNVNSSGGINVNSGGDNPAV